MKIEIEGGDMMMDMVRGAGSKMWRCYEMEMLGAGEGMGWRCYEGALHQDKAA